MANKEIEIDITKEGVDNLKLDDEMVIKYCDACKFPEEYCEYSHPILFKKVQQQVHEQPKSDDKKPEEGAKPEKESKKSKKEKNDSFILIELARRSKNKHTTHVFNLDKFGLNMKDVAKLFSKKFACSSTVTKEDNGKEGITLTGEFGYEIVDFLTEKFPNIKPEMCQVKEPKKKEK